MSEENQEVQEISVDDSIRAAFDEIENKAKETPEKTEEIADVEEKPPENSKEEKPEVEKTVEKTVEKANDAPQSWGQAVKAKWAELPAEVKAEIQKRENDIHQMMTRHDGELRLGRDMKDVISPYMPIIQAEGGNPVAAVQSLLNTAYQLRTAPQAQKAALIQQIAQQYGVDLGEVVQQQSAFQNVDPAIKMVLDRLNGIENKFTQQSTLQEQQEQYKIQAEIQAFASNPENSYFEQVKAAMAPLLASGQAQDLKQAYDMSCWANPEIRSILVAKQNAEAEEKRKAEYAKKKQAASSVTGSPGLKNQGSVSKNHTTIEEELSASWDELVGSRI